MFYPLFVALGSLLGGLGGVLGHQDGPNPPQTGPKTDFWINILGDTFLWSNLMIFSLKNSMNFEDVFAVFWVIFARFSPIS